MKLKSARLPVFYVKRGCIGVSNGDIVHKLNMLSW